MFFSKLFIFINHILVCATVTQLAVCRPRKAKVAGSSPVSSFFFNLILIENEVKSLN